MPDSAILDSLKKHNHILDSISRRLDDLSCFFSNDRNLCIETIPDGFMVSGVTIENIYQDGNTNIVKATYKKGAVYPMHSHKNSIEYLIITKGKLVFTLGGKIKTLEKGDYEYIDSGIDHSQTASEDSELFAICVPPEKIYTVEGIKCRIFPEKSS